MTEDQLKKANELVRERSFLENDIERWHSIDAKNICDFGTQVSGLINGPPERLFDAFKKSVLDDLALRIIEIEKKLEAL